MKPKDRVIEHVIWAPLIYVSTTSHSYTTDVCVIQLDKKKFSQNFRRNMLNLGACWSVYLKASNVTVYISGPEIDAAKFISLMYPHINAPSDFDYPAKCLFKLWGILSTKKIHIPKRQRPQRQLCAICYKIQFHTGSASASRMCPVTPQGLSYVPRVYLYLYSATYVSRLAYVYYRTTLPLIPDISTISIVSCFRFTDASWPTCLFGPHFSHSCCPFDSYLPPLFLTRVSHFYSYNSNLFCSLLSTILRISEPIPGFLTRLLGLLWSVLYMTLSD